MKAPDMPLEVIFQMSFDVKDLSGIVVGKGLFETDLENLGFKKKKLREYVAKGLFKLVTTNYRGAWRNTYVLPKTNEGEIV